MNSHLFNDLSLESYTSNRALPINLKKEEENLFSEEFSRPIPGSSAKQIRQAIVIRDTLFDWKSMRILDHLTHPNPLGKPSKLKRIGMLINPGHSLEKGLWISSFWGHNYFHWVTESLTRLSALNGKFKEYPVLLPYYLKDQSYVFESLEILGYTWVSIGEKSVMRIKDLVTFERTAPSFNYHQKAICKLRDAFRNTKPELKQSKKIYISRSKATKRRLINENELLPHLIQLGYEIHQFEQYNLQQQMELMIQATHLAGIHGAGLTNMLYMAPESKVLEFRFVGDRTNNCFFTLASDLGHSYYYTQNDFETPKNHLNSNMILDIPATVYALNLME